MWIYCKYITKNGMRIYPHNAKCFRFWVEDKTPSKSTTPKKGT